MAIAKQVIDFNVSKGFTTAQSDEHQRNWQEKSKEYAAKVGNYDFTRTHLNFEITKGGKLQPVDMSKSIPQKIAENLAARGIKDPNEGLEEPKFRTVVNFILGGSRSRMLELAFGDQEVNLKKGSDNSHIQRHKEIENWAKDIYQFMADRYGEENIVSFICHLDETNPHLHCTLLPIDENNRFAYKRIFAGKDKFEFKARTSDLHDAMAKVNIKYGLHRGESKEVTHVSHRSTEDYRRHLDDVCFSLEDEIANHKMTLAELQAEIKLAEKSVKGLRTMIKNNEERRDAIIEELDKLKDQLVNSEGDNLLLERNREKLEKELAEVEMRLADKKSKLSEADQKLATLKEDMESISARTDELKEEARASATTVQQNIREEVTRALYEKAVDDFTIRLPQLSINMSPVLDGSLIVDVAEQGNHIVTCAMLLFAGYVDQATTFAKGHGGGGSPGTGWGRDPKEDDREWARRCAAMAARMMKGGSGRKMKR